MDGSVATYLKEIDTPFTFGDLMNKGFLGTEDYEGSGRWKYREVPIKDKVGRNLRLWNMGAVIPKGKSKSDILHYKAERLVWGQQSDDPEKVSIIEELLWDDGRKELRFCYRTMSAKKGAWTWGQYALIAPKTDIEELLNLAAVKGMLSLGGQT